MKNNPKSGSHTKRGPGRFPLKGKPKKRLAYPHQRRRATVPTIAEHDRAVTERLTDPDPRP